MPRITITVPDKTPQPYRFELDRQTVTMGRGAENDIAIDCASVSVKHAEMRRIEGGYELRDVGSTNGIKFDGVSQEVITLRNGISATLGDVTFDFQLTGEECESLWREKPTQETPICEEPEVAPGLPPIVEAKPKRYKETEEKTERGGGIGVIVLFVLLALLAFFIGMAMHYKKDTGASLIDAIKAKSQALKP